jgi:Xaa-Pro aminopeptidase
MVLRLPENVLLATGYWVQIGGLGIVAIAQSGGAMLLVPDYEGDEAREAWDGDVRTFPIIRLDGEPAGKAIERHLRDFAAEHGLVGEAIGYEGSFEAVAPPSFTGEAYAIAGPTVRLLETVFAPGRLVDLTPMLESVRAVKTANEVERLRLVNRVAALGLDAFKAVALPGVTEVEVAAEVEHAILLGGTGLDGARVVRGYATVSSGADLALGWQYFRSRDRTIADGDAVMLELGTVVDGFWADHTRTVVAGVATGLQREAFAAVLAARDAAFAACIPGVSAAQVDGASRAACAAAGFEQFAHHTGHGVGFRYHESNPQIVPASTHTIAQGMVVAVEPGIYNGDVTGIRWEDDAVVTATGAEPLVETTYSLD